MSLVLDPNKKFVGIDLFYVEEVRQHGNSIFHFIHNREELDEWKQKGYALEQDRSSGPEQKSKPQKLIQKITTHWTRLTWKDTNTIISRSVRQITGADGKVISEIDGVRYRDLKLKMCLKKWTLTDEQGQPIPVEPDVIDNLDPTAAQELLAAFEKVTEPTEQDIKD